MELQMPEAASANLAIVDAYFAALERRDHFAFSAMLTDDAAEVLPLSATSDPALFAAFNGKQLLKENIHQLQWSAAECGKRSIRAAPPLPDCASLHPGYSIVLWVGCTNEIRFLIFAPGDDLDVA
jgi:hypothetical protein